MKSRPSNIRLGILATTLSAVGLTQKSGAALNAGNIPSMPYEGFFPSRQPAHSKAWGMSAVCRRMVRKNKLRRLGIAGQRR